MLATLTHEPFSSRDWIYERKLDGVRCLAFRRNGIVRLMSRNRKQRNDTYPELVTALSGRGPDDFIVDGEIVAFSGGRTSFARLQGRMQLRDPEAALASGIAVYYYLFDLLHLAGFDTTGLQLRERKALLRRTFQFNRPLRFTAHRNESGKTFFQEACRKRWEGVIAKRAASHYVHHRSTDWLKFKCVNRQEFVVGGFTEPHGKRTGIGALLLGYHDRGRLRYAGKVGTGFDDAMLEHLRRVLGDAERATSPFDDPPGDHGVHWVTPRLVAEIGFTEWTRAGRLRHPRFEGLRDDKPASDVTRE